MNPKYTLLSLLLLLIAHGSLFSQCHPDRSAVLETNKVRATYHNGNDMWWDLNSSPAYEVPKQADPADRRHSAFASGIWMGGIDGTGALHISASTYRQSGVDYFPGPYRANGGYECDTIIDAGNKPLRNGVLTLPSGKTMIFVNSGYTVYDYKTNAVTQYALLNPKTVYTYLLLPNGKVMLVGDPISGYPNSSPITLIDTSTFANSSGISLNHFHLNSSATLLNNGLVLICGLNGTELYDPVNNTSTSIADPNTLTQGHSTILLSNGKVLLVGGGTANLTAALGTKVTEIFDPTTNTWTTGPSLLNKRYRPALVKKQNGSVLVLGGELQNSASNDFGEIDPTGLTYTILGTLVPPNSNSQPFFVEVSAHKTLQGKLLVIGNGEMGYLNINSNHFTSLNFKQIASEGDMLPDGTLLLQGNQNDQVFRRFDPAIDEFAWGKWQKVWKVSQDELSLFQSDFTNGSVNFANYPDIGTWPAHGNVSAGEDLHLAPFVDANGDGNFLPGWSGDYPCIPGDEALYYITNDAAAPHTESGGDIMGIQMETTVYAYDCNQTTCPDTALDYTTFYHYELQNKSGNDYHDFYFSFWQDGDIGFYADDYVGCDTSLDLGYFYNGDVLDDNSTGYGLNPPAFGTVVLDAPNDLGMEHFVTYNNDFSMQGVPENATQFYGYMQSKWKDGSSVTDPNGNVVNHAYPGDAGFCGGTPSGWHEGGVFNSPWDRRFLMSIGPLDFNAGDTLIFDFAAIWQRAHYNDQLGSVCELKSSAANISSWWDGLSHSCFNRSVDRESPLEIQEAQAELYPNPAHESTILELGETLKAPARLTVTDAIGRVLISQNLATGSELVTLFTDNLDAGIYLVNLHSEQVEISKKLVVRH